MKLDDAFLSFVARSKSYKLSVRDSYFSVIFLNCDQLKLMNDFLLMILYEFMKDIEKYFFLILCYENCQNTS